jgi:Raf kinase inhibitor-like YbhB/YbcL family protein
MKERVVGGFFISGLLILSLFVLYNFWINKPKQHEVKKLVVTENKGAMKLTSSAFENDGKIPAKYTCDGENINPALKTSGVPPQTKSLVLIMDDPDAPGGTWDHWVVFNIPPTVFEVSEGKEPPGVQGKNSWGKTGYGGPCPPSGEHRYFFRVLALNTTLNLPEGATKNKVLQAAERHILDSATLLARYARK